jgi:AhpD family alkylhydroperoxidase
MARLPYADPDAPGLGPLVERIVAERGELPHLYQQLLHSPPVAAGWLTYLTTIRHESSLPGTIRELVIMRVALLNHAPYEAEQHAPVARREGVTEPQLADLAAWETSGLFDDAERAALAYTDAMTREVHVPDAVFAEVRAAFDERRAVELTATIAAYNMVSRFLEALQVRGSDPR